MKPSVTVLISSAGRRVQLMECFRDAARRLDVNLRLLATDLRPELSAACQLADEAIAVPACGRPEFASVLADLCERRRVDLVVPTIDPELPVWSERREDFAARGVTVAVSAPSVITLARDKFATAAVLRAAGVVTPRTMSAEDYVKDPAALGWPVILKPRSGSSSVGLVRPRAPEEARTAAANAPDLIAQELWVGKEYTVNVFFDATGRLRCAIPHWRIETRAGEVSKGRTENLTSLRQAAARIAGALPGARGALCFQAIAAAGGEPAVFEINARFGGGYPLAHRAGARFAQWLLEERLGRVSSAADDWRPGVTMLRYDAAAYRDE